MVVSCRKWLVVLLLLVLSVLSASVHSSSSSTSSTPVSLSSSASAASSSSHSASSSLLQDTSSFREGVSSPSAVSRPSKKSSSSSSSLRDSALSFPSSSSSSSGVPTQSITVPTSGVVPSALSSLSLLPSSPSESASASTSALTSESASASDTAPASATLSEPCKIPRPGHHSGSNSSSLSDSAPSSSSSKAEATAAIKAPPTFSAASVARKAVKDKRVLQAVEKNLLTSLGLTSRPKPAGAGAVPQYMVELYRRQLSKNRISPYLAIDSPFLRVAGRGSVPANTVRSFHHSDHHVTGGCAPETCTRFLFNVSTIPVAEVLAAAELRVFVNVHNRPHHDRDSSGGPRDLHPDGQEEARRAATQPRRYKLEVYEIMHTAEMGKKGQGDDDNDLISRLIDTRVVRYSDEAGWESFDIHPAVLKWKKGVSSNQGLEVRLVSGPAGGGRGTVKLGGGEQKASLGSTDGARSANGASDVPVSSSKHVRLRRSTELSDQQWSLERPLLVAYTDDGRGPRSYATRAIQPLSQRPKRSVQEDRKLERRERRRKLREGKTRRGRKGRKKIKKKKRRKIKKGDKNMCRRYPLYVDFSDVGWNDWIVAPDGYNAYYCQGDCNFPLANHLNTTNHAIVQLLVNSVDPSAVPKACCVPTELSAISMLYLDEWEKVVLKNYQDMVVEGCGCR